MIFLIYGEDSFRSKKRIEEIIAGYKKRSKRGLEIKSFSQKDFKENGGTLDSFFQEQIWQRTLFSGENILLLTNFLGDKDFQNAFLKKIKEADSPQNIFLLYQTEPFPEKKIIGFLKEQAECQEFNLLEKGKLKEWTKKEAGKYGFTIDSFALDKLTGCTGSDLWQLSGEINKLALHNKGKGKKEINAEEVEALVRPKEDPFIFSALDALASGDKKKALRLLKEHLKKGDSVFYLLSMINFQFRNIIAVKDFAEKGGTYNALVKKGKISPFLASKSINLSRNFTLKELKKIYRKLLSVDVSIKTGKMDPGVALDLLIAEI
jgi:DNA polymerase III subunit delta